MKRYYTFQMKGLYLNVGSMLLFFPLFILLFFLFNSATVDLFSIVFMFLWLFLHELFHGLGFLSSTMVKMRNITYGIKLESGIFYCMCKQEITKRAILVALVFPLFFLGIFTFFVGWWCGSFLLSFVSVFNISGAIGDIIMMNAISKMPKDVIYLDLDDPTSFTIVSNVDLSNKVYFGLRLFQEGVYDPLVIKAHDKRKLVISKTSIIMLSLFLLFFLLVLLMFIIL